VIESGRIRWRPRAAYVGKITNAYNILVTKLNGRYHYEKSGLRCEDNNTILKKQGVREQTEFIWLR
jgi:hypothetical protein